jgi:fibronectin-binding autotransporter adhesin
VRDGMCEFGWRTWCFVALGMAVAQGNACADTLWTDGGGSWFIGTNWSAGVPASAVGAQINNGGTARVFANGAQAGFLTLGKNVGESGNLEVFSNGAIQGNLALGANGGTGLLQVGASGQGTMTIYGIASVSDQAAGIGVPLFAGPLGSGAVSVIGPNASWTNGAVLSYGSGSLTITGGGTVTDKDDNTGGGNTTTTVSGTGSHWTITGTLELAFYLPAGTDVITVDTGGLVSVGGTADIGATDIINIGSGGVAGSFQAGNIVNNGTLHFNHTGAVTFSSPLSGAGGVLKDGAGSSTVTNAAGYTGSFTVQNGQLILKNTFGAAAFNADSSGLLRFDAAVVNLGSSAIRANGSVPIEYNNSTVNGGFLRGTGTHTLLAGGTNTFNGSTSFGANIVQDGMANFNNFTNAGALASNAQLNFNGGVNTSSGTFTVNNELIAQDFSNDGIWIINNGGQVDNGTNNLVCGGGSRTTLNAGGVMFLSDDTSWELNGALLINDGEINGTTNVNFGSVAKGSGSYEIVNVLAGGALAPGNGTGSVTITGNYAQAAGGSLLAELGGTTQGSQYDSVAIAGAAHLDGMLDVSLVGGFTPAAGDSFELLRATGGILGAFSNVALPALSVGLSWNVGYSDVAVLLQVTGVTLAGDYNQDGIVDAADYVVWRKNQGTTNALPNDPTGGTIGTAQYNTWRTDFGQTAGSGSALPSAKPLSAAVPEPATWVLLMITMMAICAQRRHTASRFEEREEYFKAKSHV